ncbi:MAG: hypothetical protein UU81_C0070G0003 [Microgenomates group bacterium GW2011_GWC1_41_8]|nr:MAG: hypothetical protein UU81_C0070G0003 [Microgenomates group bacterium GW2011_GWC1_41_8]
MNYITKNFDNDLIDCSITSNYDEEYINIYPTLKEQELLYLACKYPRNPGCCDVKSKIRSRLPYFLSYHRNYFK